MRMLDDDHRQTCYQDYTATMLKVIAQTFAAFVGGEFNPPSFIDLVYPEKAEERQEETPKGVISHVLSLLQPERS